MIQLVKDTIDNQDIDNLIGWLKTYPRLTKGNLTIEYEKKWSEFLGCKYSVFVNSGSSANLLMLYALIESGMIKVGDKVVVPAVSWSTDLTPVIQLGLEPVLCDCNMTDLSVDLEDLQNIIAIHKPSALILVSVLGMVPDMDAITKICEDNNVVLLEDACESLGSKYEGQSLGTFGLMSSFSTYFGHHISTIEGGMICTNDKKIFNLLKSLRSHGWDRDMDEDEVVKIRQKYSIGDDFDSLYKFYYYGFNLRATDLQAFIGLNQLEKVDKVITNRNNNYNRYKELIFNDFWTPQRSSEENYISNFAYPMIHPKRKEIVKGLKKNNIETRPLICGSLGQQPFWIKRYGEIKFKNAGLVNDYGFYLPNNHQLTDEEIQLVCKVVNESTRTEDKK
tara:strand:- start:12620 stop:13795 length:1176 start_codon:yes stop_codon:yes gene_type:complete